MNRVFSWKRMACILTAAVLLLSVSCVAGEVIVYVDYDAEPVRAENAEAFNGVWQARYYAKGGVTVTFESLLEDEIRYEHPGWSDEEVAAGVAEEHYAVEIRDGIILNYMGGSEPQEYEAVFEDGKLVVYGVSEIPITVEILSDGNLRVYNGNFSAVYEKVQEEEFLFRGKIRWGMSQAEVTELEGESGSGSQPDGYSGITYPGIPVSRYTGELTYLFAADRLVLAVYMLAGPEEQEADMYGYLREALDAVYGEEAETAPDELYQVLAGIGSGEAQKEGIMNMPLVKWVTAGDTRVLLAEDDNTVYIVYVSPDFLNTPAAEPVDTTGL